MVRRHARLAPPPPCVPWRTPSPPRPRQSRVRVGSGWPPRRRPQAPTLLGADA
jgi:hypothetical protein